MQLIVLNKPFQVMCQFTSEAGQATLADYVGVGQVYPAGRLDYDSEGLVILTDHGPWQAWIADPRYKLEKRYWVQVEGVIDDAALQQLQAGVLIQGRRTLPATARAIAPPDFPPRYPSIRSRQHIPTSWLELALREGRNRQVRRMTAAVGFPTLRLIRFAVGPLTLAGLDVGAWRHASGEERAALKLPSPRVTGGTGRGGRPHWPRSPGCGGSRSGSR